MEVLATQAQLAELTQLATDPHAIVDGHIAYHRADGQGTFVTVWFRQATLHHFTEHFDATGTRGSEPSWVVFFALSPQEMGREVGQAGTFVMPAPREHGKPLVPFDNKEASSTLLPLTDIQILFNNNSLVEIRSKILSGEISRQYADLISVEEQAVIAFYTTGEGYRDLNLALRGQAPMTSFFHSQERLLNTALAKLPKFQNQVIRGTGESEVAIFTNASVGDIIEFDNFVSSSLDEALADDFMNRKKGMYVLRIKSKTGVNIVDMSMAQYEDEVLFPSKKKFRVTHKTYRPRFVEDDPLIKEVYLEEV